MGGQAADQPCCHRVWQVDKVINVDINSWPMAGLRGFGGARTLCDKVAIKYHTTSTIYNHY